MKETKICEICGKEYESIRPKQQKYCSKECFRKTFKNKYYENIEKSREISRISNHKSTMKLKNEFFEEYGNKCAICGQTDKELLTVGHINNDGRAHRILVGDTTRNVLKDLKNNGWPKDIVQIECYNCQASKKILNQSVQNGTSKITILRRNAVNKLGGKCIICGCDDINCLEITRINRIKSDPDYNSNRIKMIDEIVCGTENKDYIVLCANCNCKRRYKRD